MALLLFVVLLTGCAVQGGPVSRQGPFGTLPGTYTVPVTLASSGQSQTLDFTLTVRP